MIAAGMALVNRVIKAGDLLRSLPGSIDRVYVADTGPDMPGKAELYDQDWPFDLVVIDHDAGTGIAAAFHSIMAAVDEEYILLTASDHVFTPAIDILVEQLERLPEVGGIAGTMVEPDDGRIRQPAKDYFERGIAIVRSANLEAKEIEWVAGHPFVRFDHLGFPVMFRSACFEDYAYDPVYHQSRAHIDFFIGHWRTTDWAFGICPSVHIAHYPGPDPDDEEDYYNIVKAGKDAEGGNARLEEKWGYETIIGRKTHWFDTHDFDPNVVL